MAGLPLRPFHEGAGGGTAGRTGTVERTAVKALRDMTTEELNEALETLDSVRPEDTALRLALYLELRARRAAPKASVEGGSPVLSRSAPWAMVGDGRARRGCRADHRSLRRST